MHTGCNFEFEIITKEFSNCGLAAGMQCRDMHRYGCGVCYAFRHGLVHNNELKMNRLGIRFRIVHTQTHSVRQTVRLRAGLGRL